MEIQVYSDLHLEFYKKYYPLIEPKAEILLLLGDIGKISSKNYLEFIKDCSTKFKYILIVLGNHEYYHSKKSMNKLFLEYQSYFTPSKIKYKK